MGVRNLMLHLLRAALVVTLLTGALPVVGQGGDGFPRTLTDASGVPVVIPAYPARVAVIGTVPALAQVVAPADLIALDLLAEPDAARWDGVGLLVLPEFYATAYPAWVANAESAGVPVFRTGAITSLDGWRAWLATLGTLTGREAAARRVRRGLDAALWAARWIGDQAVPEGDSPPRVLVLTPESYTVGQGALLSEIIGATGAINAAAQAGYADYRQLTAALIRDLAPDIVLLTPAWGADGRAAFLANPAYAALPAVQTGRVCLLPFDSTRIARPGVAALLVARLVYGGC